MRLHSPFLLSDEDLTDILLHWPLQPVSGFDRHVGFIVHVNTIHSLKIESSVIALNVRSCVHVRNPSFFNHLRTYAES